MSSVNMTDAMISALVGGTAIAVISSVPVLNFINYACCLGILLGGFLATLFYKSRNPIGPKEGAIVGLFSGIFGGLLWAIFMITLYLLFPTVYGASILATGAMLGIASMTTLLILNAVLNFLCAAGFGTLGGLIGGAIFKSKGNSHKKA